MKNEPDNPAKQFVPATVVKRYKMTDRYRQEKALSQPVGYLSRYTNHLQIKQ